MNVKLLFHYDPVTLFFLLSIALEKGNGDKEHLYIKDKRAFELPYRSGASGCSGGSPHTFQSPRSSVSHSCQVAMQTATAMIRL